VASMVVLLDSQEAILPLRAVAREFAIDPASPDGVMLGLIEEALEFVVALRLGDKLPSELNGGEASWNPSEEDRRLAASRARRELVRCVFARMGQTVALDATLTPGWEEAPANRKILRQAIDGAATLLDGMDAEAITSLVASISDELAYIETMRRTLARGMSGPQDKLLRIRVADLPAARRDTVHQVQALARRGLKEIDGRFDTVDASLDDFLAVLRDVPAAIGMLRRQRDWLFRTKHAWEPVFGDWKKVSGHIDEFFWKVIERTYTFLAPRFMSFKEWNALEAKPVAAPLRAKVW